MIDKSQQMTFFRSIAGGLHAAATFAGTGIDTANLDSLALFFAPDTLTDGVWTPTVEDSPDNSVWTAVAAAQLVGPALVALVSNTIQKVGYVGTNRYVRPKVVGVGGSTGCVFEAVGIGMLGKKLPMAAGV